MKIPTAAAVYRQNSRVLVQEALPRGYERPVAKGAAEDL
jgi:hypothetical protein